LAGRSPFLRGLSGVPDVSGEEHLEYPHSLCPGQRQQRRLNRGYRWSEHASTLTSALPRAGCPTTSSTRPITCTSSSSTVMGATSGPVPSGRRPRSRARQDITGDRHALMLDTDTCYLYELFYAYWNNGDPNGRRGRHLEPVLQPPAPGYLDLRAHRRAAHPARPGPPGRGPVGGSSTMPSR